MGYTSKFTGAEIDNLLSKVQEGGSESGGGIEVYDLNIELPEAQAEIFFGKSNMNNENSPLRQTMIQDFIPSNSFVNVKVNERLLYSAVSVSQRIEGMNASVVVSLDVNHQVMGAADIGINPSIAFMSVEGMGTLVYFNFPYESSAWLKGLEVTSQDTNNLKHAYENNYSLITLNYTIIEVGSSSTSERATFRACLDGSGGNKCYLNDYFKVKITVDSTGTIQSVQSVDPAYIALEERIKALENGN